MLSVRCCKGRAPSSAGRGTSLPCSPRIQWPSLSLGCLLHSAVRTKVLLSCCYPLGARQRIARSLSGSVVKWLQEKGLGQRKTRGLGLLSEQTNSKGKWQPTPVLPGKSHRQRSLVGYSPWSQKRVGHMEFSRQEYWSGSFPSLGDLPNPGI